MAKTKAAITWDKAADRTLRLCVAEGHDKGTIARRLRCGYVAVSKRMEELGLRKQTAPMTVETRGQS
jgi:hypothetical protein